MDADMIVYNHITCVWLFIIQLWKREDHYELLFLRA